MKLIFNRIFVVLTLVILSAVVVGWWQKERFFPPPFKTPVSAGEIVPELVQKLEKAGLSISEQPIVLGDSMIASVSGVKVLLDRNKDLSSQVRALQLVLGRLTIDKLPKEIDLRFSKVIIKYQ